MRGTTAICSGVEGGGGEGRGGEGRGGEGREGELNTLSMHVDTVTFLWFANSRLPLSSLVDKHAHPYPHLRSPSSDPLRTAFQGACQ